jgi:hypothetical protein
LVVIYVIVTNITVKMNWIDYMPHKMKWICRLMAQRIAELLR